MPIFQSGCRSVYAETISPAVKLEKTALKMDIKNTRGLMKALALWYTLEEKLKKWISDGKYYICIFAAEHKGTCLFEKYLNLNFS